MKPLIPLLSVVSSRSPSQGIYPGFRASSPEIKSELSLTYYLHEAESVAVFSVLIVSDASLVLLHYQFISVCSFFNDSSENDRNKYLICLSIGYLVHYLADTEEVLVKRHAFEAKQRPR